MELRGRMPGHKLCTHAFSSLLSPPPKPILEAEAGGLLQPCIPYLPGFYLGGAFSNLETEFQGLGL